MLAVIGTNEDRVNKMNIWTDLQVCERAHVRLAATRVIGDLKIYKDQAGKYDVMVSY